jgi:hypothetical protein
MRPPPPLRYRGVGALARLMLLRAVAAPALPRADTCPEFVVQGNFQMPAGVTNGGYANAACKRGFDRQYGHTVFQCDTSAPRASQWQSVGGSEGEKLLCVAQTPHGCSGSPDATRHYENRTLELGTGWDATCADGYRAMDPAHRSNYVCRVRSGDFKWVFEKAIPDGKPLECTAEPGAGYCTGPPGVHFRSVTAKDGGPVVAECEDGYVGTGSSMFVCRANSEDVWAVAPGATNTLECTLPTCRAPPAEHTSEGKGKCAGTQVGKQCTANCANGYTPRGNPTYTCGDDGAWTGGSLRCLKSCTLPQSLPRTWHAVPVEGDQDTCEVGQTLAAGEKCTIGCQAGYSQEAGGTYVYECGMDSQLVPPSPDCNICSKNTFNPTPGASACEPCGAHCTSGRGSVRCSNCTAPTPCNGVDCGHGSCQPLGNTSHTCQCEDGWTQEDFGEGPCDHPTGCDASPCQHGGTCVANNTGGFVCHCETWKWGGKTCTEAMGCHDRPCGDHGTCTEDRDSGNGFSCNCTQGWSGKNCVNELPDDPGADNNSRDFDWKMWGPIIGGGVVALLCLFCCCYRCCCSKPRRAPSTLSILRESLIGPGAMPGPLLAHADVGPRWTSTQQQQQQQQQEEQQQPLVLQNDLRRQPTVGRRQRVQIGADQLLMPIMFHNEHVQELEPHDWSAQRLGQGAHGTVHKVRWRGRDVAVKVIKLPEEQASMSQDARSALRAQLRQLMADFVAEVEVCCDVTHPNLVQLLGFATEPRLYLVQEFMAGSSVARQLHVEKWRPSVAQVRKVALDVARGMAYMHSNFERPILHRDLKSPNLLLCTPPDPSGEVRDLVVKISDFGLSKDKQTNSALHTVTMTTVGTLHWMAPEILLEKVYNEKIDVCKSRRRLQILLF